MEPEVRQVLGELNVSKKVLQQLEYNLAQMGYVSVESFRAMDIISDHTILGMRYDDARYLWDTLGCSISADGAAMDAAPLFERIGGKAAVEAAVELFYEKIIADSHISHWFKTTDMNRLMEKQRSFLTMAFGGATKYDGKSLTLAHADMVRRGMGDADFDAVAGHLQATLEELGIPTDLVAEILGAVASLKNAVLGRGEFADGKVTQRDSLYERIGGAPAVDACVDKFYTKVVKDKRVQHWFRDMDMKRLAKKQRELLTMVFGGPSSYSGADLRTAHAGLVRRGLGRADFAAIADDLESTLSELGVPVDLIAEVMVTTATLQPDILGEDAAEQGMLDKVKKGLCDSVFEGTTTMGSTTGSFSLVTSKLEEGSEQADGAEGKVSGKISAFKSSMTVDSINIHFSVRGNGAVAVSFSSLIVAARATLDLSTGVFKGVIKDKQNKTQLSFTLKRTKSFSGPLSAWSPHQSATPSPR